MKNDGITLHIGDDGIARVYDDTYDITIHCESAEEQEKAMELLKAKTPHWVPVTDGDEWKPTLDEDGESDYILLSFDNLTCLCIGQYRENEEGGSFYHGDDDEPLLKRGFIVNAWMPLPGPYRDEE